MKKLKRAPTPAAAAPTTPREPITFRVNVILPSPEKWSLTAEPGSGRFLVAGASSPWRDLSEVPESLRAFIGQPDPPPFEQEALEAEQEAIRDSFGPVSESIAEDLARRQRESADDARALNAIASEKARRGDQFERDLQAEHDAEVQELYQQEQQKPTKKGKS